VKLREIFSTLSVINEYPSLIWS